MSYILLRVLSVLIVCGFAGTALASDRLLDGFRTVPNEARMRMYWRIFGPAWTNPEIDYQLTLLREAGVGGVTAYFMYPVALDDPGTGIVNQRFGSREFLSTFGYATRKAKELGLRFAVNGSTGWPFGGSTVSLADSAQRLRRVVLAPGAPLPKLGEGEKLVAAFQNGRLIDGSLAKGAGALAFISGPTGMHVKRPSFGAEGLVVSHYDTRPLQRYLASVVEPMLRAAEGHLTGVGCDSLEVYSSNWTGDLPRQFKKRRGYDLLPYLPELFDEKSAEGKPVRFDFWRTLAELTEERFTKPLGEWAGQQKVDLEMEAYGTPPNPMTSAKYISLPTGEHYEWKGFSVQKYVSSAADLNGRKIIGSEAWTWAGLPNRLADSLSDLKLVSDMTFLAGANDLTGVDFPYSPRSAGAPGWQPYYGPTMNQNNPQWRFFPAFVDYVNRCQWMLRQGRPVRNVAVYLPVEDAMANGPTEQMLLDFLVRDRFVTGKATSEFGLQNALKHQSDLLRGLAVNGYDYDGIDLWAMNRLAHVQGKRLVAGDASFGAMMLPNLERIDLPAFEKIAAFCKAGGVVIAARRVPDEVAGKATSAETARLRALVAEVFGDGTIHSYGKGVAAVGRTDEEAVNLLSAYVPADLYFGSDVDSVGFVHRAAGDRDIYLFVNTADRPVSFDAAMEAPPRRAERWDPMSGMVELLRVEQVEGKASSFQLELPARGSAFVVLSPGPPVNAPVLPKREEIELNPAWHVTFEGPDAPAAHDTNALASWTGWPGGKYFSGLATYQCTVDWDDRKARSVALAFDSVHEAAEVRVNGQKAGVTFSPPWTVEIGRFLRSGANTIEVIVGNLPVNRFIGQPDVDLGPLRAKYGNRFPAPEEKTIMKQPAPSGLIGRVRLLVAGG